MMDTERSSRHMLYVVSKLIGHRLFQDKRLNKEKTPSCCKYYSKKCQRHYLEGVKISVFPNASSAENPRMSFELKWREPSPLPEDVLIIESTDINEMDTDNHVFGLSEEHVVSQRNGRCVVHYYLKDSS